MKRNLGRVLIALLVIALLLPTFGCGSPEPGKGQHALNAVDARYSETNEKLSDKSPEELLAFLQYAGLVIPEGCDVPEANLKIVSHYVQELENDPNWGFEGSMIWYHMLALRVKVIVDRYYGYDDIAQQAQDMLDQLEKQK